MSMLAEGTRDLRLGAREEETRKLETKNWKLGIRGSGSRVADPLSTNHFGRTNILDESSLQLSNISLQINNIRLNNSNILFNFVHILG